MDRMDQFYTITFATLQDFYKQRDFCDFVIKGNDSAGNDVEFHVHRIILAANSSFFRTLFQTNMKEKEQNFVYFESISKNVLEKIIHYCYSGTIDITPSDVEEILDAANMLTLQNIVKDCFDFYRNNINVKEWLQILKLADKYNYTEIKNYAQTFALKNFHGIVKTEEFLGLTYDNLLQLISHNNLNVHEESDVYEAVLKWVKYKDQDRKQFLKELLKHIRFPILTRKYLIDVITKEDLIITDSACREYLYKALDYHLVPERRCLLDASGKYGPRIRCPKGIYVFGGENRTGPLNTVEIFDLTSCTWIKYTEMKTQLKYPAVTVANGIIYVIGGIDYHGNDINTVSKFDPIERKWCQAASMKHCKGVLSTCVLDGWIYAVGGSNGYSSLNNVERYDPETDSWLTVQSMKFSRSHFGVGIMNNTLYAIGGLNGHSPTQYCEKYDGMTNTWLEISCLNKPRMDHGVTVYGEKLFAIGGISHCGILDCIEKYNFGLHMWLIIKHTLDPRTGACISLVQTEENKDNRLFIIGGIDDSHCYHSSVKEVNLKAVDYTINSGKSMLEPRAYGGVVAL